MCIIHNGQIIPDSENILLDRWKYKTVFGDEKAAVPDFCVFNNTAYALDLLKRHIDNNSKMVLHTDVDVDGIGTTYILKKILENLGSNKHVLLINKDKVHGIQEKHAAYFNKNKVDLMIITDSSCNEIEVIKKFECDVLVIDHHEVLHGELLGYCNDGIHRYIIVNSTISNSNFEFDNLWLRKRNIHTLSNLKEYIGTQDMSCGLVVYELMRLYCECFANPKLLENLMLSQWVGVTLITDVINTLNDRNQWYLDQTVFNMDVEKTLRVMMQNINKFKATLDKSYIGYSFAPLINKAIRAGESASALHSVINNPASIVELDKYKKLQEEAVDKVCYLTVKDPVTGLNAKHARIFNTDSIMLDIGKLDVNRNYSGVIASRLSGDNNKNCAVYVLNDKGLCKGSFRGRYDNVDYRKYFESFGYDIYAQGHPGAFGFELRKEQLDSIMNSINSIEPVNKTRTWLTAGNMEPEEYGEYHITDFNKFKQLGYVWRIATGNAKVTSNDEVMIRVKASDVSLKYTKGKLFIYDVLGMECKAFKALAGEYFDIYIEYTNEINFYIR